MNIEKYTQRSQGFLQSAQTFALNEAHQQLLPEHLLKVLLDDPEGMAMSLLQQVGVDGRRFKAEFGDLLKKIPKVTSAAGAEQQIYLSRELGAVLTYAEKIAEQMGDEYISQEVLLLGLLNCPGSAVNELAKNFNVSEKKLQEAVQMMRKGRNADSPNAEDTYEALKKYCINLTEQARQGKLDPVIGRDEEIRRTIQVLSRRTKNNPVLIGEPGVGKTAILEGLAQRIIKGDVPESLKEMELMSLDLGALLAGAKFRGDFEERLKSVVKEITHSDSSIVLFIDELHTLVGAGKADGAMDASNMLKPALARGELHCVGATTLDEYRQHIEKDAALARRFQPVYVNEPTVEDTISILRGLKEKYEMHHGIRITDGAIVSAVTLSNRYITDRFLPDKAIDLMDEATSRLRMTVDSKPENLDELDRRIIQMKIEQEALKKEKDSASQERLKKLQESLKEMTAESERLNAEWAEASKARHQATALKEKLERLRNELETARRNGDLERASRLMYSEIPSLEKELESVEASSEASKQEVAEEDIATIVSKWTGIPLEKMMSSQQERLLKAEEYLRKRVVGQEAAISAVANAIRRSRAGLQDPNRPLASFLFLGPTGVGKTELAKSLAVFLFDDEHAMTRIDMSEYMEKHSISRLIGSPPGYVGYEEGGKLTEAVRRRPYQIILFDEVEKAHADVFNVLLQVLDDGILTDSHGRTVDFKNTILILTSNLGSEVLSNLPEKETVESARLAVMEIVRNHFRPEFLNRLDEILLFGRLERNVMKDIVEIQLQYLKGRLKAQGLALDISHKAITWLADVGYDPVYGARPLKRVIQKHLQDPISMMILEGRCKEGAIIKVDEQSGSLAVSI
ncbi:MAG: ATP-dependent chaperone ClpB [Candidatus Paracaedibacteraceae bacterium]|nr:ATP-dependent chaperone ClpB [Candidatus Paracaedibacteraceae bacterium]